MWEANVSAGVRVSSCKVALAAAGASKKVAVAQNYIFLFRKIN